MIEPHPSWLLAAGALLAAGPWERLRRLSMLAAPLAGMAALSAAEGRVLSVEFAGLPLTPLRADALACVFAWVFLIIGFLGCLFAVRAPERRTGPAALAYLSGAVGAVLAGDLLTLLFFWETMSFAALFLIWQPGRKRSAEAGFRYLLVHVFGGAALFLGVLLYGAGHGFDFVRLEPGLAADLVLLGFCVNAAVVPLHAWLPDAYPEGSPVSSVFLTAYTTKTAVYALARGFPGTELLAWAGAGMAVYGVVFAMMQNDARRLLSYHIVSQVGIMVCGIGIGTPLAVNGAVAHAFSHVLYKGLLFMAAGALLQEAGTARLSELGGLSRRMPWTLACCMVGAWSISGVPPFNGFISKSMTLAAAAEAHRTGLELLLEFAAVGTFLSVGLKLPWLAFFDGAPSRPGQDPPAHQRWAMGLGAALCLGFGLFPDLLYARLPHPVEYRPYAPERVAAALQLLSFVGLGFWLLRGRLKAQAGEAADVDRLYRALGRRFAGTLCGGLARADAARQAFLAGASERVQAAWRRPHAVLELLKAAPTPEEQALLRPFLSWHVLLALAALLLLLA